MTISAHHKDSFTRQFVRELLTQGESHGHQVEDLYDVDAFPELGRAITGLALANDPQSYIIAATRIRSEVESAAHTLAAGVFDVMQAQRHDRFVKAQLSGHPQPHLA